MTLQQDSERVNMPKDSNKIIVKWHDQYRGKIASWARSKGFGDIAEDIESRVFTRIIDLERKVSRSHDPKDSREKKMMERWADVRHDPKSAKARRLILTLRRTAERQEDEAANPRDKAGNPRTESLSDDPPSDEPGSLDALVGQQVSEEVMKAIERLDPKYRSVVLLRLESYTHKEIAEKLGIPRKTSRSRLKRGLDKVRKTLLQWWKRFLETE